MIDDRWLFQRRKRVLPAVVVETLRAMIDCNVITAVH